MEQIERIAEMEKILRNAKPILYELRTAIDNYRSIEEDIQKLDAYYGSEDWWKDLEADETGILPEDLLRGVLSQDEVYDVLEEQMDIIREMQEICDIDIFEVE